MGPQRVPCRRSASTPTGSGGPLRVTRPSHRGLALAAGTAALLWPATGWFLLTVTDTDVPWWDAFPTGLILMGQFGLGRKYIENWGCLSPSTSSA